jgi:hypothetical protein
MANMNIRTPRFYCDSINYRLSRGVAQNTKFDVQATSSGSHSVGIKSGGGVEADLFDMRPSNLVTFDTSSSTTTRADHVIVSLDVMGESNSRHSFVAILNHNCSSADAKIRISASDTKGHIEGYDFGSATALDCDQVLNANSISTNIITPASDGSTIVTFAESHLRYIGVQFEGDSSFSSSTDLTVGCIIVGEFYDMPHSPDLNVKRNITFDSVNIQESIGGQRYSNMANFGRTASSTSKSPFLTTTANQQVFGGRVVYDMNFSYLNSTDLMPDDYSTYNSGDDSTVEDIWNKVNGPHIPFIFTADGTSTSESDYLFARFAQDSLEMNQVANDIWNMGMKIEEEF